MKIRIYSPFLPYPVTEGAYRVIFDQVVSLLTLRHEVELVTWKDEDEAYQRKLNQWVMNGFVPKIRRLNLSRKDSPLRRVLTSTLTDTASPELFYYPPVSEQVFSGFDPCDLAIYHYGFAHHWLKQGLKQGLKQRNFLPKEAKRVVYFHNLESELFELRAKTSPPFVRFIHRNNARILQRHERDLASLVDELWFISPVDLKRWMTLGDAQAQVQLVPPTYTSEILNWHSDGMLEHPGEQAMAYLGFVGGVGFKPNQQSILWILKELVPELERKGFKGRILVLGKGTEAFFRERRCPSMVEVLPESTSLAEFFSKLSWMLVPHVSGSGVRIKLLDALARKIPVLATPEAVERLHPELQQSPLIFSSSDPGAWADQVVLEKAFQSRLKFKDLPFAEALRGEKVYEALLRRWGV